MAENENYISCLNKEFVTNEDLLLAVAGQNDGKAGLRLVVVESSGEDFIDCNNNDISIEDLFRNIIAVDTCGNPAIRIGYDYDEQTGNTECCEPLPECKNPVIPFEIIFKRLLGKGTDGKPFLRICSYERLDR